MAHRPRGWFAVDHLPDRVRPIGEAYAAAARALVDGAPAGMERTRALSMLIRSRRDALAMAGHVEDAR